MENNKKIIWVYGSLRKEEYNNYLLKGCEYLGRGIVRGYKMFSFGNYPFVVPTGNDDDKIFVEGYEVDERINRRIEMIELCAGYYKAEVDVKIEYGGIIEGNIYAMEVIYRNYGEVPNGDWVKSKKERYESMTHY